MTPENTPDREGRGTGGDPTLLKVIGNASTAIGLVLAIVFALRGEWTWPIVFTVIMLVALAAGLLPFVRRFRELRHRGNGGDPTSSS
jgi:Flp pilus assembly protein TadB